MTPSMVVLATIWGAGCGGVTLAARGVPIPVLLGPVDRVGGNATEGGPGPVRVYSFVASSSGESSTAGDTHRVAVAATVENAFAVRLMRDWLGTLGPDAPWIGGPSDRDIRMSAPLDVRGWVLATFFYVSRDLRIRFQGSQARPAARPSSASLPTTRAAVR